jgi:ribosomal protein S18 acetylase RimI-like enzyme
VQAVAVTLRIRPRVDDDLDACEAIARATHAHDGYPAYVRDDDFRTFVARPGALGAWVAEIDGALGGHVALHTRTTEAAMQLASSRLGVSPEQCGVIARLIVSPDVRRRGVGVALLQIATDEARALGLAPILDVVTRHDAAIALYESAGWLRVGSVTLVLPDGSNLEEYVYRAP